MRYRYETPEAVIHAFLEAAQENEYIRLHRRAKTPSGNLYALYESWCAHTGQDPMSRKMFGTTLDDLGYPAVWFASGIRGRGGIKDLLLQPRALTPKRHRP